MLGCYIQQTAKYFREGLVLIPLIQKASLRCHRSLEPRVLRWLEDKQVQNLGLLIPGHHTFHLQRAKPSPSRNAQMQKFHQALTIGLPEISFLHISQTWDYQVFFLVWTFILQCAFKTVMCQGPFMNGWEPEAWGARDPRYCPAPLQGLVLAIRRERRILDFVSAENSEWKEALSQKQLAYTPYKPVMTTRLGKLVCAEDIEP